MQPGRRSFHHITVAGAWFAPANKYRLGINGLQRLKHSLSTSLDTLP